MFIHACRIGAIICLFETSRLARSCRVAVRHEMIGPKKTARAATTSERIGISVMRGFAKNSGRSRWEWSASGSRRCQKMSSKRSSGKSPAALCRSSFRCRIKRCGTYLMSFPSLQCAFGPPASFPKQNCVSYLLPYASSYVIRPDIIIALSILRSLL